MHKSLPPLTPPQDPCRRNPIVWPQLPIDICQQGHALIANGSSTSSTCPSEECTMRTKITRPLSKRDLPLCPPSTGSMSRHPESQRRQYALSDLPRSRVCPGHRDR